MANKNKKYTNKNLKAERSTTDTFYSKQKPIFKDSQSPYTASIFSNEGDTPELNWVIQHMEPFSSMRDAYGIYDAARRGDRADLNKSILSQIIPFVNYSDIDIPKEVKDAVNRTESENKDIILNRDKKAYGGTLDPSRGKEFTEDRTARGYYYYLGESNKSKLLDKLALAKSRLTPYAEGGFIEEEGDGPGTPKKSPAPKKAGIDKELLIRQQFKESSFDPKAKSGANARGLAQIMDEVEQDAKKAGVLKKGEDIYNPEVNTRVQKWYMDNLYNSSFINKPGQKEDVKIAKALAAYNYGRGNVLKHLNEKKAAGVDIYNSFDWLKGLPTETTDYVNKILRKTDPSFEKQYNEAVKTYKYKAKGGSIEDDNKKVSEKDKTTVVRDYRGDTYYSPEEDTIYLSRFANEDVELPHELYHAQQAKSGRLRVPSYDPYGEARRKPSIAEEQDLVDYPYYNRSTEEQKLFLNRFLKNNPSFQFVNPEAVYNYQVNPAMYNNPRTAEGQARLAESPEGVDFLKRKGLWLEGYAKGGELIKRADGSYSRRGLWDNIRANKGSGKKPTKEMLEQEAKIKAEYARGGEINLTTPDGEKHIIYKKESPTGNGKGKKGNIMVTHPTKDKGKWDTIDLTDITDGEVKTVAEGKKSTLKWHKENPETKAKGGWLNNYK